MTTEPPSVEKVIEKVKAVEGVEKAEMVFGAYDVCFEVEEENMEKLKHTITRQIPRIDNVRAILTLMLVGQEY